MTLVLKASLGVGAAILVPVVLLLHNKFHPPRPFSTYSPPSQQEMPEINEEFHNALDTFAVDFYGRIRDTRGNVFFSPLSISSALMLVYAGAEGETKAELDRALHFEKRFAGKEDDLLAAYQQVVNVFSPPNDDKGQPLYHLSLANRAYLEKSLDVNQEYLERIKKYLHSEASTADFKGDAEGVRSDINKWVEQQTNSKIRDLIAAGAINPGTLMVLVNAIYFKANWFNKFDAATTQEAPFLNADGSNTEVDLMHIGGKKYFYYDNADSELQQESGLPEVQAVEIPYQEKKMSMWVFLPKDPKGLPELESALTADKLNHVMNRTNKREVQLWLPKFKVEHTLDLVEILPQLGIRKLFGAADLGRIATGLQVSGAVHKAFVEVNEEGTEAAAATAIMMTRSLHIPMPPAIFRADHPFIFAIRHEETGAIVFMGRISKF